MERLPKGTFSPIGSIAKVSGQLLVKNAQLTQKDGAVRFRYYPHRDNPDGRKEHARILKLSPAAFFDRYLQHIPEPGSVTLRHCGLYANGNRQRLNKARECLAQSPLPEPGESVTLSWRDYLQTIPRAAVRTQCRQCQQPLNVLKPLPRIALQENKVRSHDPP